MFVASIVNQFPIRRWQRWVSRWDQFTVLPHWTFFAPNPGYTGTHLVYRDRDDHGWSSWTDVPLPGPSGWRGLWNPGRFERKAVQDLFGGLARSVRHIQDPRVLELTTCHLALLTWVDAQPALVASPTARQFAIVETMGHGANRSVRPVFVSRVFGRGDR